MELRKQIAISIAQFLLNEVQAETNEKPVDLYMKWKTKYNVKLRHPETAKYALKLYNGFITSNTSTVSPICPKISSIGL